MKTFNKKQSCRKDQDKDGDKGGRERNKGVKIHRTGKAAKNARYPFIWRVIHWESSGFLFFLPENEKTRALLRSGTL